MCNRFPAPGFLFDLNSIRGSICSRLGCAHGRRVHLAYICEWPKWNFPEVWRHFSRTYRWGQICPYHSVIVEATWYHLVEYVEKVSREFCGSGPQSGPTAKISNRHISKPEVDFAKIPTAFKYVLGTLKIPLIILRQGALEVVELEKVPRPKNFKPNFLKICKSDFF